MWDREAANDIVNSTFAKRFTPRYYQFYGLNYLESIDTDPID